ncbi:hypothetical protein AAFF_G00250710 [Aldrovandia affinis]|uniref:Uncharacterized protein n=1 Tax=Aldrovandia affinis TaxID=143900 RepID=A0AAD7W2J3_9TELE|nr:hypothetical protein AAFF_G00250710 [Aldrovandia affinis]
MSSVRWKDASLPDPVRDLVSDLLQTFRGQRPVSANRHQRRRRSLVPMATPLCWHIGGGGGGGTRLAQRAERGRDAWGGLGRALPVASNPGRYRRAVRRSVPAVWAHICSDRSAYLRRPRLGLWTIGGRVYALALCSSATAAARLCAAPRWKRLFTPASRIKRARGRGRRLATRNTVVTELRGRYHNHDHNRNDHDHNDRDEPKESIFVGTRTDRSNAYGPVGHSFDITVSWGHLAHEAVSNPASRGVRRKEAPGLSHAAS